MTHDDTPNRNEPALPTETSGRAPSIGGKNRPSCFIDSKTMQAYRITLMMGKCPLCGSTVPKLYMPTKEDLFICDCGDGSYEFIYPHR